MTRSQLPAALSKVVIGLAIAVVGAGVSRPAASTPDTPTGASAPVATPKRFALIVANNHSLDEGLAPLHHADDDGARYHEMFRAMGASVALLTVLDPAAQDRYPDAAAAAIPPTREALRDAVRALFDEILVAKADGHETHLYFVYSGHGSVGPNREGYLHLLDARFGRSALYREVVAASPATFNHLLLDACNAYYLVHKRGQDDHTGDYRDAVKDFLRAEELTSYPNTGVLFGASSEAETHEWGRWEAGIFSHELRSALLGAADVDGDGALTYPEVAACVEAANASVDNPKARLKVYHRAPAMRVRTPLVELADYASSPSVDIEAPQAGRYHVEDSRGVRIADLHSSAERPTRLALVGRPPFFLRSQGREARIEVTEGPIATAALTFEPRDITSKGSVDETFRRHLYAIPFDRGFYQGMTAAYADPMATIPSSVVRKTAAPDTTDASLPVAGIAGGAVVGLGALALGGGIYFGVLSMNTFREYQNADGEYARDLHRVTDQQSLYANLLYGAAGGAVLIGGGLIALEFIDY